jgi:hypothetical protein
MALDLDKTKVGRRSSRFGSKSRSSFRGRHSSRGVLPLNQGSSPHGSKSVLPVGGRGGGFGSGRPAGGGGGQGVSALTMALMPESLGPAPEVGPPPVDRPLIPPSSEPREHPILFPSALLPSPPEEVWAANVGTYPTSPYVSDPTQGALPFGGLLPRPVTPEPDSDAEWFRLGRRWAR